MTKFRLVLAVAVTCGLTVLAIGLGGAGVEWWLARITRNSELGTRNSPRVVWLTGTNHSTVAFITPTNLQIGFRADGVLVWRKK